MRIHRVCYPAIMALAILTSYAQLGCSKPCNPKCGFGERCDDGTCVDCGHPGETCCQPNLEFECFDGVACDNTHYPICVGDCGSTGLPCCEESTCPGSGTCSDGMCIGNTVDCGGDEVHSVAIIDEWGCVQDTYTYTSGAGNAQECAEAGLAAIDPSGIYHLGPIDSAPTCQDVCKDVTDPFGTYTLCTMSPAELASCEYYFCSNCTWTDGECPP